MARAADPATADFIEVIHALTGHRRGGRVRLIELADSEPCFDGLLECVSRMAGLWRCQRLVVGDGVDGRPPGMRVETRVTARPLSPVCVVDHAFAAVPSTEPGESPYVVVDSPPVVRALAALHEIAWAGARPGEPPDDPSIPAHLLEILNQAASGATDFAAQRRLRLSSRTYSRRMSALLAKLDARSRFQAGVIAARRGLV